MNRKPYIIPSKTNNKNMERYLHRKLSEIGEGGDGSGGKSPYIGENGHWFEWNAEQQQFVDTGVTAQGPQGSQGLQGNTGSSVAYPFELVNNLTTDDATKALSAAQGVVLDGKISQLRQEVTADVSQLEAEVTDIVTHHSDTQNLSGDLAVASGGQDLYFYGINFRPGRKYSVTLESDTDNAGYFTIRSYNSANTLTALISNTNQNINGNPYTIVIEPTENYGGLNFYIRSIATAGTVTITVVEEWNDSAIGPGDDVLKVKTGKNLANPDDFIFPRVVTIKGTTFLYLAGNGGSRGVTGYIPIKSGQTLVCNVDGGVSSQNYAALFKEKGDIVAIPGTEVHPAIGTTRTITNNLEYDAYAVFGLKADPGDVQVENGSSPTTFQEYSPIIGYGVDLSQYAKKTELAILDGEIEDVDAELQSVEGKVLNSFENTEQYTGAIVIQSGNQSISFPSVNLRPGRKYTFTVVSDTSNQGYIHFRARKPDYTSIIIQEINNTDINDNPTSVEFIPSVFFGNLEVVIRNVSAEGTLSLTIKEEWDNVNYSIESTDALTPKPGKNLAAPFEFLRHCAKFVYAGDTIVMLSYEYNTNDVATGYIPIKDGETLVCNTAAHVNSTNLVALFKEKGDLMSIPGTLKTVNLSEVRTITNNLGYDAYAVFYFSSANTDSVQVEKGDTPSYYEPYDVLSGYYPAKPDYSAFGTLATFYSEEIDKVFGSIANSHGGTKLHFVHLSDNHGGKFGDANIFTDASPASFLVNTGDLVADKFSDSFDVAKGIILSMTKPGYVVLGNHDCYQAPSLQARYEKYIEPLNTHNGLTGNTKTYYSVDFATEKVKCIFLDMCDGRDNVSDLNMTYVGTNSLMSPGQINWFAAELQAARTNGYDVVAFIHLSPDYVDTDRMIFGFFDDQVTKATSVSFLCDMVDAFIDGGTVTFNHGDADYSFTFVAGGKFAGWMCGHTHYDCHGWLKDHPKQFSCSVPRPNSADSKDGTYRVPGLGVTYDYVTINAATHILSVLRVGNNETIHGTLRDAFYIKY